MGKRNRGQDKDKLNGAITSEVATTIAEIGLAFQALQESAMSHDRNLAMVMKAVTDLTSTQNKLCEVMKIVGDALQSIDEKLTWIQSNMANRN